MGYTRHDAVIVTTSPYRDGGLPDIDAFRMTLPEEFRHLVIGPFRGVTLPEVTYVFLPDGSSEGWEDSRVGDGIREQFKNLFRTVYDDGSSTDNWVHVQYGSDFVDDHGRPNLAEFHPRGEDQQ